MLKKITVILLAISVVFSGFTAFAYEFPHEFWEMNSAYVKAVESNDKSAIIGNGLKILNLMKTQTECTEVINVIADRSQRIANTYAELEMYDESAKMFEFALPYLEKKGWKESVLIANAKIPQYTATFQMYTDGGSPLYYGAKNEPENGMLFGTIGESSTRALIPNESVILMYHELGGEVYYYNYDLFDEAKEKGLAVEFALNCIGEGNDIANFESKKSNIYMLSELFKKYPDVPIFVRFGAEMNVWTVAPDPQQYIDAFRYTSTYFKNNNPNVAMVWSPAATSGIYTDMNDFYPGDEYVDWVGMSLYCVKYFMGDPNRPDYEEAYFKSGANASPVLIAKEIVEKYGDRKPIMIAESGFSHKTMSGYIQEETTSWAINWMREFYNYLPMVYPQIKFVAHFDKYIQGEINDFSLMSNSALQNEYVKLTQKPHMIKYNSQNKSGICYRPLWNNIAVDGILPVYSYIHVYDDTVNKVDYYVDGVYKGSSFEMPFNVNVNLQNVTSGNHTLKGVATTSKGKILEKEYPIVIQGNDSVNVKVENSDLLFDVPPVTHLGRTMVPLRAIFEALGATVEWNDETSTVTSVKNDKNISLTVGDNVLYVNDNAISLDVPAMVVDGRTLVPVRAVSESLDCKVGWDDITQTVNINK